jgi:hypothetical protein
LLQNRKKRNKEFDITAINNAGRSYMQAAKEGNNNRQESHKERDTTRHVDQNLLHSFSPY